MPFGRKPRSPESRFWAFVDKTAPGGCWLWTGDRTPLDYGNFHVGSRTDNSRRTVRAHRFSWELHRGSIPPGEGHHGTCVLHTCDVRWCVNPDHLWLGSVADNNRDREAKGRGRSVPPLKRGEAHGGAKLTDEAVRTIRAVYAQGDTTQKQLAATFGVGETTVAHVVHGESWRHVV